MDGATGAVFDRELAGCHLVGSASEQAAGTDGRRHGRRHADGGQDQVKVKAAYRFFFNDRFSEAEVLAGPFQATRARFAASDWPILVVRQTTELSYQRERPERIGLTSRISSSKDKA